jgi:hypothetical protein
LFGCGAGTERASLEKKPSTGNHDRPQYIRRSSP